MDKQELMNKIKEQCGDCEAWSGTDCTRNPYTQGCLKDEKKTTDEVIKLLELFANDNEPDGVSRLAEMALDLIHRLQSENAERKAEIERLKANEVIECHGMLKGCDMVKQAVKDTAKEILEQVRFLLEERNCVGGYDLEDETIDGTIFVEVLNELKERYGVEELQNG